jgi:hypothetical protein
MKKLLFVLLIAGVGYAVCRKCCCRSTADWSCCCGDKDDPST